MQICLWLAACLLPACLLAQSVPAALQGQPATNPGCQARCNSSCVAQIKAAFIPIVNKAIPTIYVPDVQEALPLNAGSILIKGPKLSNVVLPKSHDLTLQRPDTTVWTANGLSFEADSGFESQWKGGTGVFSFFSQFSSFLQLAGNAHVTAQNVSIIATSKLAKSSDGKLQQTPTACTATFGSIQVTLSSQGLIGSILNLPIVQSAVNKKAQAIAQNMLCAAVNSYIKDNVNEMLSLVKYQIPLIASDTTVYPQFPADLILDYTLIDNPVVETTYLTTNHKGEVSWKGQGGIPFYPAKLNITTPNGKMLNVWASDHVTNSMLYTAQQNGVLNLTLNEQKTPQYKAQLMTQCLTPTDNKCLGNVFPEMALTYTKQACEVIITPTVTPYVLARSAYGGYFDIFADGLSQFYATNKQGSKENFLSADTHMEGVMVLNMTTVSGKPRLIGSVTISKLNFTVRSSKLTAAEQRLNALSVLIIDFIQKVLNDKLKQGFALPAMPGLSLTSPNFKVVERTMMLGSDFTIDQAFMTSLSQQANANVEARRSAS